MMEWWHGLDAMNQWFYGAAAFFSVIFLWQLVAALLGLAGDDSAVADGHADAMAGHDTVMDAHGHVIDQTMAHDALSTVLAFKLLSIRSMLAFLTMFTWAGALYLNTRVAIGLAVLYAFGWGLAGMFGVALIFHFMRKLQESGNPRLDTCVGQEAVVHLDIPAEGNGEIRVGVSGIMSHVRARTAGGQAVKAGARVKVVRLLGPNAVEVQPL